MGTVEDIVALLEAQLSASALIRDDNGAASFVVVTETREDVILRLYVNEQGEDVIFSVGRIREQADRLRSMVPRTFEGYYAVKIYTINKTGIDGRALRERAIVEVKRVFAAYPDTARVFSMLNNDHQVGVSWMFCTEFTVLHVTES